MSIFSKQNKLVWAASRGNIAKVRTLLKEGADVNAKDTQGIRALDCAVAKGRKDMAEFLIAQGAGVNAPHGRHGSQLHFAIDMGNKDMAEWLIAKGADVNAEDDTGSTPLHIAVYCGNLDMVELLIDKGANVNGKPRMGDGSTPAHIALRNLGLSLDLSLGLRRGDGSTPLHIASRYGELDMVELLIAKGADVNAKDNYGGTPLHYAIFFSHNEVAVMLIVKGADVNAKANDDRTPLHLAAESGDLVTAELLVFKGADLDAKDMNGNTPLDFAIRRKRWSVIALLQEHRAQKVSSVRIWRCPQCQAVLEKGALGKTIFSGESTKNIKGSGTCANCGATFAQSDIYGGKYDFQETSRGVEKAAPPEILSLIIFLPGQTQPSDPKKYYQDILKKAFGDSGIEVEEWRIAGTKSLINVNEARSLYSEGKKQGILPDFGEPDLDWSGKGLDGREVTVLFFL